MAQVGEMMVLWLTTECTSRTLRMLVKHHTAHLPLLGPQVKVKVKAKVSATRARTSPTPDKPSAPAATLATMLVARDKRLGDPSLVHHSSTTMVAGHHDRYAGKETRWLSAIK